MNYLPRRRSIYPAQEDTQQAKFNPRMNVVIMYVSYGKYKINKKSAGMWHQTLTLKARKGFYRAV
jgi:hypothetical protein